MTKGERERTLRKLLEVAEMRCRLGDSTEHYEVDFVRLLEFIVENPDLHSTAEQCFLERFSEGPLCHELLGFCMHTLRFKSVREEAERRIRPDEPRGWGPLSDIVSSFEDDWEDRDFYDYYSAPRCPPSQSS